MLSEFGKVGVEPVSSRPMPRRSWWRASTDPHIERYHTPNLRACVSYWQEVRRGEIPRGAGVYVVYQNDVVVYVGSSTNLWARVRVYFLKHRGFANYGEVEARPPFSTPWGYYHSGRDIRVKVKLSRRIGDWLMWEWRLIHRLQPHYNRAGIRG